jgi:CHAT domain-containing protein
VTPTIQSWQKFLDNVSTSLASDAASSAIEAGNLETAVELLEQGRTILWSKLKGFRHPLDKLRDNHPDLADEFDRVCRKLEHHAMFSDSKSPPPGFYDTQTTNHRLLSEKWNEVVQQIRQIDGFQNFLQAVPFASLQLAAAEGPVIVVNISQYRSDAIIIRSSDPPVLVCLPDASPTALHELSTNLSAALALDSNRGKHMPPILRKLWELVVSPIVDQFAILGVEKQPRIWWCPTGPLCALPLHAAGPYKLKQSNLPDLHISSYTPTLSSLIRARSNAVRGPTSPKLLVMGQPNDHLEKLKLPYVKEELSRIQTPGRSVDVLVGEQATRETLLLRLEQYSWVHFACHGYLIAKQPFLSYFQLHDKERLTLSDLMKARLPDAELAFLSACNSAAINVDNTPDEVIHLAAGLQFCGFRSVVGTLWSMVDDDGPDVAEDFYKYMFRQAGGVGDFRDSAMALNHATREMRRRGVPMDRWINFVHIGA